VLHGLQSAHVSADVWRKHALWARHAAMDFNVVAAEAAAIMAED
jgi:hypothetical protein